MIESKQETIHNDNSEITSYMCDVAKIKYDSELRREDSIIQQAGNMQTAFSFCTAVIFMLAPVAVEYRGSLSLNFFFIAFSSITLILLFSLFAATMAQNRKMQKLFPNANDHINYIIANESKFRTKEQRNKYLADSIAEMQLSLTKNNNFRVIWVRISMISFYVALSLSFFWFVIAICKMI